MKNICLVCLQPREGKEKEGYHSACAKDFFGGRNVPVLDLDPDELHLWGLKMAGVVTLSGIQEKVALSQVDKMTLRVSDASMASGNSYILKPDVGVYPDLPVNEQLCSRFAKLAGIDVPPSGLIRLKDGKLAFLSKRFDRKPGGIKVPVEDFCQLDGKLPREKYNGSVETCEKLLRKYSTQPALDGLQLFRAVLFSWWIGNTDMHLKNLSLMTQNGRTGMTPFYDLVSVLIVLPEDQMALALCGKKSKFKPADWLDFAERCRVAPEMVARVSWDMLQSSRGWLPLTWNVPMRQNLKSAMVDLIVSRAGEIRKVALYAGESSKRNNRALRAPTEPMGKALGECANKLREALRNLGLTDDRMPFREELDDLDWASHDPGPLFRSTGLVNVDKPRVIRAFKVFLRLKAVADFLWEAERMGSANAEAPSHLGSAEFVSGWISKPGGDRLFELEVAAALHQTLPMQVRLHSGGNEPDLFIVQSDGHNFGIECKRPESLKSIKRLARKGVEQVHGFPGMVVLSLDKIIKGGWLVGTDFADCVAQADRELNLLVSKDVRKHLQELVSGIESEEELLPRRALGFVVTGLFGCSWPVPNRGAHAVRYHFATTTIVAPGSRGELIDEYLLGFLRAGFEEALR